MSRRSLAATLVLLVILAGAAAACDGGETPRAQPPSQAATTAQTAPADGPTTAIRFTAVQDEAGLDFRHVHGGSGAKYMAETMGAGGGLLDYDGDGDLDVYLVQGGPLPGYPDQTPLSDRLYQNDGTGRFTDVTEPSGLGDTAYGMGTCFGDVENDGDEDIYVANFGPDSLWINDGDGTFRDGTAGAGIDNPLWASSCAFADYDRDGWLDLFVVNYVDHSLTNNQRCGPADALMYCHPDAYNGVPDVLWRNRGDGTFQNATATAGVLDDDPSQGKGLGVSWIDIDDDGWLDLFVANDSTRQFLYHNQGDGTLEEVGVMRGAAFNAEGATEAGMGVAIGDIDQDGWLDIFLTTLDIESNTLFRNEAGRLFEDLTDRLGLSVDPERRVGFGTEMLDADSDGDVEVFVGNGHIIDNIAAINPSLTFEQTNQLYEDQGDGRFVDVAASAGPAFATPGVARATAAGDIDGDGDLDILVTHNDRSVVLLRNDSTRRGRSVLLDLRSRNGGRPAVGAKAWATAGGRTWVAELRAGGSYQGQGDHRLHIGIGDAQRLEYLVIRWPEGDRQTIPGAEVALDRVTRIVQPPAP